MKKTLIMTIIIALMLSITSVVNAATLSAQPAEVKKGETVTITIDLGQELKSADFTLKYDTNLFSFVSTSAESGKAVSNGARIGFYSKRDQVITVQLQAKADSGKASIEFIPEDFSDNDHNAVQITANTANVTIVKEEPKVEEPKVEDPKVEEPKAEETAQQPAKKPTTYAKTGYNVVNYVAIVGTVILLAVVATKSIKK